MCKTGTTPKRPAAFASASAAAATQQQLPPQISTTANSFFPNLFGAHPPFFSFQSQLQDTWKDVSLCFSPTSVPTAPPSLYLPQLNQFPPKLPFVNVSAASAGTQQPWFQQHSLPQFNPMQSSQLQAQMEMLGRSAAVSTLLQQQRACPPPMMNAAGVERPSVSRISSLESNADIQLQRKSLKRFAPEFSSDSSSAHSDMDKQSKGEKQVKRKHEATLDGERRVAIEFENIGTIGEHPQKYGKGALLVPHGVYGKYSAFGQRWRFTISHAVGPVICEDGVSRMCLSWSVTNLNSGLTHSVVETPTDAMKRDRDGKTLCNRVFRDILSLRASALEAELRNTEDPAACVDLQSQLRTIQTKRFSEGPLFFGLRHFSLQQELRKELHERNVCTGMVNDSQARASKTAPVLDVSH